jgi:Divergent InlB B-repeat domain
MRNACALLGVFALTACSHQDGGPPSHSGPAQESALLELSRVGLGSGVIRIPAAGVECASACSARLDSGSEVSLIAVPQPGSRFVEWLGGCQGSGPCSLVAGAAPAIAARFEPEAASDPACRPTQRRQPTDLFTGGVSTTRTCLENGWCWENGPVGQWLTAVWAAADDDVWAVGSNIALHWDGSSWTPAKLPRSPVHFYDLWGSATDDVWAVGPGVAVHWDGSGWSEIALPAGGTFWSVSGSGASDVWILGTESFEPMQPIALHWDGRSWSRSSPRAYGKIFALAPGDAIAVWGSGCERFAAGAWRDEPCGVPGADGVWASGRDDVWVTGHLAFNEGPDGNRFYRAHWDGVSWAREDVPSSLAPSFSGRMFGRARNDVWWGNLHFDGETWSSAIDRFVAPSAGVAGGKLWAVSGPGILESDGSEWKVAVAGAPDRPTAVGGLRGDDVWVLMQSGAILRYDGGCWETLADPKANTSLQNHVTFGSSSADIWALGSESWHWDGLEWSRVSFPAEMQNRQGGWSNGPADAFVFAVDDAQTKAFHWNGQGWSLHARFEGERLLTWWGTGADDLWLGGYRLNGAVPEPRVWHWDGASWSAKAFEPQAIGGVERLFGTIRGDVWMTFAVGNGARHQLLHWNGKSFALVNDDDGWSIVGGAGSGPEDLWRTAVVTVAGVSKVGLLHLEKDRWAESPFFPPGMGLAATGRMLRGIPGFGLVAAGDLGAVYLRRR